MSDLVKIGALWLREGKKGKFFGGEIELDGKKTSVLIFKNGHKEEGSKQPDYQIYQGGEKNREPGEDDAL